MTDVLLRLRLFAFVVCGWLAGAAPACAQGRGEALYFMHCSSCHKAEMHWRASKAVTDWPSLQAQVRKWQVVASLAWTEDEVLDVARYLNDSIYHFELANGLPPGLPAFEAESCRRSIGREPECSRIDSAQRRAPVAFLVSESGSEGKAGKAQPTSQLASHAPTERNIVKTDSQLKEDVTAELDWDPSINSAHVGVAVKDGVVTLTGHLDTYAEKYAIERAVQRVRGVRGIAVEVDVKLDPSHKRSDSDIAAVAESALKWHSLVPSDRIQVMVEKGWVTLTGELDWEYQRREAEKAVRTLTGVVGVSNAIALKPPAAPADVSKRIRDALVRHAESEANLLDVKVKSDTVTLHGTVDSWSERAAASSAAWSAPGVAKVINEIKVQP